MSGRNSVPKFEKLKPGEAEATPGMIDNLKIKARAWAKAVVALHNTPVPPEAQAKKDSLLSTAKGIRWVTEKIIGPIDELSNAGLGFPFVVVAVAATLVTGTAGAMTWWITDTQQFLATIKATGKPPVDKSWFEKIIGNPQKIILPIALGALVVWYFTRSTRRGN